MDEDMLLEFFKKMERVSNNADDEVEKILQLGRDNPLTQDESLSLLKKVSDKLDINHKKL